MNCGRRGSGQFAPQPRDRVIDRARMGRIGVTPHLVEQLIAVRHGFRALGEIPQQREFAVRQVDRRPVLRCPQGAEIDRHGAEGETLQWRPDAP
jgi:hypothetical protein